MATDIKADLFIYNDQGENLIMAADYVASVEMTDQEKRYYQKMIRIKKALNSLKGNGRFLFNEYFFRGFELELLPKLYNLKKSRKLPEDISLWREILAKACAKFWINENYGSKLGKALAPIKIIKDTFASFDTCKHGIHQIINSSMKGAGAFEHIHESVLAYEQLAQRAAEVMRPHMFEIIKCNKLDKEKSLIYNE